VDPIATHPWRTLEAPTEPTAGAAAPPESRAGLSPGTVKAVVAGMGAIACGALAFILAFGGGGGEAALVDGGGALGAASLGPVGSGAGVGGGSPDASASGEVVVEIVGAVQAPGVFRLPAGSRVGELVAKAGGYGPRVDTVRAEAELNLAATLTDGDRIRVPSRDDPAATAGPVAGSGTGAAAGGGGTTGATGPVDLNHATAEQLDTLPGVGPVTVQKIMAAREEAPFTTVDELQSRGIVGAKTLDKLRELVTVG